VALAAALPVLAAAQRAQSSVVGGTAARPGAYPWMVALSRGCGASLIAPDRVLTAGHCVEEARVVDLSVYVGAHRRRRGTLRYDGRSVRPLEIATHPGYRTIGGNAPANDVAVIQLSEPVEGVTPVRLAGAGDGFRFDGGSGATVIGWGVTRSRNLRTARMPLGLRQGRLTILSDRTCGRWFGTRRGVYRAGSMLCARSRDARRRPATSPCVGDSGGPLVNDGVQVGVVSFGVSCGALREPTVFARVAPLRGFIDDPSPVWAPQPLGRAGVAGRAVAGAVLTCVAPDFRNEPRAMVYRWGIDGYLVARGARYRVPRAAAGHVVQCRAIAANAGGRTASRSSAPLRIRRR
jgi:secreted trypsin-like serine protease